jgi:hypothetical protein
VLARHTLDHVVVVDVVGLIKDYNEGIFDGVSEELVDIVDGRVFYTYSLTSAGCWRSASRRIAPVLLPRLLM